MIPWTAGGWGDGQLAAVDQTEAPECQDGGFNAAKKEKWEEPPETRNAEEEEAFEKLKPEEKEEEEIERSLEGPHDEEPNQQKCPTADGYCDVGLADLIINQLAVEQQNIVTDPLLHSWQDAAGNEVTDECRNWFAATLGGSVRPRTKKRGAGTLYNQEIGGGKYYLGESFNLAAERLTFPGVFCTARHQAGTRIQRHQPGRRERHRGLRQRRVDHHAERRRRTTPRPAKRKRTSPR